MATNSTMNREEPQPSLRLDVQALPPQKVNINHMPLGLYNILGERADKLGKKVPTYCRIVLEHANNHREDYTGPYKRDLPKDRGFSLAIHIPIKDKEFMLELLEWDPYGQRKRTDIAISILRKHIEVRKW